MKQEDITRLKEICEKEGFELEIPGEAFFSGKQAFTITKKDPWEGVEFAKCINDELLTGAIKVGKIYPIDRIKNQCIGSTLFTGVIGVEHFTPSTETEYIEQLKKESFERFGDIKRGDRVSRHWLDWKDGVIGEHMGSGFQYKKGLDLLLFEGSIIYESGQWATKFPERVKVEYIKSSKINLMSNFTFKIKGVSGYNPKIIGYFLSKKLEKYLNDNQE